VNDATGDRVRVGASQSVCGGESVGQCQVMVGVGGERGGVVG